MLEWPLDSLFVTGAVATYTISATTNLANPQWLTLLTTNYPAMPFTFVETNAVLTQRFYRAQAALMILPDNFKRILLSAVAI
jgi:hypothetical protein